MISLNKIEQGEVESRSMMSQPTNHEQISLAHANAASILIMQFRHSGYFDLETEQTLIKVMARHMHLMLCALKQLENEALSEERPST